MSGLTVNPQQKGHMYFRYQTEVTSRQIPPFQNTDSDHVFKKKKKN